MSEQAYTADRTRTKETSNGHRPLSGFTYQGPITIPGESQQLAWRSRRAPKVSFWGSAAELGITLSGVLLSVFMFMHLGLLSTSIVGADTMDGLAGFLEKYYLLQAAAPLLILGLLVHVVLSLRRAPTTFKQQTALVSQMRRTWHLDTWTWSIQLVTGLMILALAAIHLWVVLSSLPIEASKSAARVNPTYIWIYVPFVLAVEAHISAGLYRVLAKWGLVSRLRAHLVLGAWTIVVLGLGFTILATLYNLGGGS